MRDRIIRVTGLILALTGLVLLLVGAHEGRGEPMLGGMYCFTVGVLLPSTTYQEDPDQEDQEETEGRLIWPKTQASRSSGADWPLTRNTGPRATGYRS